MTGSHRRRELLAGRRCFATALACAAAHPLFGLRAQTLGRVYRLGILAMGAPTDVDEGGDAFDVELARLGFVKGVNLIVDSRFALSDRSRLDALALELVALKPDVILSTSGTRGAEALKKATTTIPIVFGASNDPVGAGLVESLARPGRNLTGSIVFGAQLDLKRLQILAEVLGKGATLAVLDGALGDARQREYRDHVGPNSFTPVTALHFVEVNKKADIAPAFERMARLRVNGVAINFSPLTAVNMDLIGGLVVQHRLAAIADGAGYARAGVLLAYSTDIGDLDRNAARYVAKILNGANPAELPVEHASKFSLVVNLKAARTLGVRVSRSVLARADVVIE